MATDENAAQMTESGKHQSMSGTAEAAEAGSHFFEVRQFRVRRPMRSTAIMVGSRQAASRFGEYCPASKLKNIALDANGTFMSNFDPERSQREMRKLNRKIHKENKKSNQMYDEAGRLLENSLDICDCLENDCPGCHFPCPKCGSEKCGSECRCERRWTYEQVEVEGTNLKFTWMASKLGLFSWKGEQGGGGRNQLEVYMDDNKAGMIVCKKNYFAVQNVALKTGGICRCECRCTNELVESGGTYIMNITWTATRLG
ncbi:hypothetical protein V1264_002041 [Littorina saxatilis]|uniref:ARF7 effector protein C-terminal domain-containing protein n=1 Tax=Littorina saxatilis TaxID=31220 RepID=A0AAN9C2K3_9CAEN